MVREIGTGGGFGYIVQFKPNKAKHILQRMKNTDGWYLREVNPMKKSAVGPFNFDLGYKINNAIWKELQEISVEMKINASTINCITPIGKPKL